MTHSPFSLAARLGAAALFSAALWSTIASAETVEEFNETLEVSPGGKLTVDVQRGGVKVRGEPGTTVHVEVYRKIIASSKEDEEKYLEKNPVSIEQRGNEVIVRQKGKDSKFWWGGSRWKSLFKGSKTKIEYTLIVPAEFEVELRTSGDGVEVQDLKGKVGANTSGGGIRCSQIQGNLRVNTSGGGITLTKCHGTLHANTSGGGITVSSSSGELDVDTSGGSIKISEHRGNVAANTSGGSIRVSDVDGNVHAHTSGGSISANLSSEPSSDCRLSTSGGGITVNIPGGSSVDLDAATSGGRVHSQFTVPGHNPKHKTKIRGLINGGGPLLHLRTSGGSIHLNSAS